MSIVNNITMEIWIIVLLSLLLIASLIRRRPSLHDIERYQQPYLQNIYNRGDRGHDDDEMTSRCAGCLECLRTYVWPQHEVKCICGSERCMCVYVGTGAMSRDGGFHAVRAACEILQIRSLLKTKVFYIFVNFKTFLTIW